jgi:hypothetical protein
MGWSCPNRLYVLESKINPWYNENFGSIYPCNDDCTRKYFSGADYMLLHNLYWINYAKNTPLNDVIRYNLPQLHQYTLDTETGLSAVFASLFAETSGGQDWLGNKSYPIVFEARESLTSSSKIESTGHVIMRSSVVNLEDGFEVQSGADFEAYSNPLDYTPFSRMNPNPSYQLEPSVPTQIDISMILRTGEDEIETELPIKSSGSGLKIYPNPSDGYFTIDHHMIESASRLQIFNNIGELINEQEVNGVTSKIDLLGQAKGVYIIKVISSDKIYSEKLIIQ